MIKKFQIEIVVLVLLLLNIFIFYNLDIGLYNYFSKFNTSLQKIYLKEFFIQITVLGDSVWYFIISLIVIFITYLIKKIDSRSKYIKINKTYFNLGVFLFLSLIITGFFTQLLKHIVGRPRPNHTNLEENIGFNFFSLDSEFHSFPSGHSSTIFAVILVLIFYAPRLKYFFFFIGGIVAFSRVVVGAHFFTDVIAGVALAFLCYKLTKSLLDKYFPLNKKNKLDIFYNNKTYLALIVFLVLAVFFSIGPSIDIFISSLFYYGKSQFVLQNTYDLTIIFRKIILPLILIYVLFIPVLSKFLPLKQIYFDYEFRLKDIGFLWASVLINLLIIINLFFKNFWGRARPGDILQLGGKEYFTPWYQISDACSTNCSFVSGDASVGFSLVAIYFITKKEIFFWLSLCFGFSLGLIRIMEGGHFFSDIIMAQLILYLVYYLQFKYFYKNV